MRAVLTNFGTTGDFLPFMVLANELAMNGSTPVLAFPPFARDMASQSPFEYFSLGPDLAALRDHVNTNWTEVPEVHESAEQMFYLLMPFREVFDQILAELKHVCKDADVLIGGSGQPLARIVHELTGIPFVSIQLSHFGGSGGLAMRKAGDQLINPFREKLGLPRLTDPLIAGTNSPQLALYAMSSHLRPRPADWPAHYYQTGFFFDTRKTAWEPDPALERFMAIDDPPVVMTFGSMVHRDPRPLVELLLEAARITNCRAVIQGMPEETIPSEADANVYWAKFVPHEWLFPRAACVLLHGGAGTAAAVFHSGVPGIFVPHGDCYDQRFWAQLALEAGCAVPAIPYLDLTASALASAIAATINNDDLRKAAVKLRSKINKEPGVRLGARLIRELVMRVGLHEECDTAV
jgi:UDP:flavonoid glycosyltransferase YjiC (YdhE family)